MDTYQRFLKKLNALEPPPAYDGTPMRVIDPENCRLRALIWSDLHASRSHLAQTQTLRQCLADAAAAQETFDLFTFGGDMTDNGKPEEYRFLAESLCSVPTVKHIVPVSGNHDIRFGSFKSSVQKFSRFCKSVNPALRVDKLWFHYTVCGIPFLILGSVEKRFEEATLSVEELNQLALRLQQFAAAGKPVFVLLHQPMKLTHNLPDSWDMPGTKAGSVGAQSDRLKAILSRYKNVFCLTGHLHRGFNAHTYEEVAGIHCVSIPSVGLYNKDSEYSDAGLGFLLEVYDDSVLFRARDFLHGRFLPEFEKRYPIL